MKKITCISTLALVTFGFSISTQALELEPFQPISQHSLQQQAKQSLDLSLQNVSKQVEQPKQAHALNLIFSSEKHVGQLSADKLAEIAKNGSIIIAN